MKRVYRMLPWAYIVLLVAVMVIPIGNSESETSLSRESVIGVRWDYLIHFALFVPLMLLVRICFKVSFRNNIKVALIWIIIGLVLAVGTESLQYYLPYRGFNVNDIVANVVGVLLGSMFFLKR